MSLFSVISFIFIFCLVITNIEEKNDQLDEHELESKTAATNSDEQINNNSKESSKAEL